MAPDTRGPDGDTLVRVAASYGNCELLALLIANGANISAPSERDGATPLEAAAAIGHARCVTLLLANGAAAGNAPHLAAVTGESDSLQVLIDAGVPLIGRCQGALLSPLELAVAAGHDRATEVILSALVASRVREPISDTGCDHLCASALKIEHGSTILHLAALRGSSPLIVSALLVAGATDQQPRLSVREDEDDVHFTPAGAAGEWRDARDERGRSAFDLAPPSIKALLEPRYALAWSILRGSLLQPPLNTNSALVGSDRGGSRWRALENLLAALQSDEERRSVLNSPDPVGGLTPLALAALAKDVVGATWLLDHGASVEAESSAGLSAMFWAEWQGAYDVVIVLRSYGGDLRQRDEAALKSLREARARAVRERNAEAVKLLRRFRATEILEAKRTEDDMEFAPPQPTLFVLQTTSSVPGPSSQIPIVRDALALDLLLSGDDHDGSPAGEPACLESISQWSREIESHGIELESLVLAAHAATSSAEIIANARRRLTLARLFVLDRVAAGDVTHPADALALHLFLTDDTVRLGCKRALRQRPSGLANDPAVAANDTSHHKYWGPLTAFVERALARLPRVSGVVYCARRLSGGVNALRGMLGNYPRGKVVSLRPLERATGDVTLAISWVDSPDLSSPSEEERAENEAAVIFKVLSKRGEARDVSEFSLAAWQQQALVPTAARFRVLAWRLCEATSLCADAPTRLLPANLALEMRQFSSPSLDELFEGNAYRAASAATFGRVVIELEEVESLVSPTSSPSAACVEVELPPEDTEDATPGSAVEVRAEGDESSHAPPVEPIGSRLLTRLQAGTVLDLGDGRELDVEERLGEGAFGVVYKCTADMALRQAAELQRFGAPPSHIAAKFARFGSYRDPHALRRGWVDIVREAALVYGLSPHRNIVLCRGLFLLQAESLRGRGGDALHHGGSSTGPSVFASEPPKEIVVLNDYVEGTELRVLIDALHAAATNDDKAAESTASIGAGESRAVRALGTKERAAFTMMLSAQLASAIAHLHRTPHGIVHQDVKVENVMVTSDGMVQLFDFGLAAPIERRGPSVTEESDTGDTLSIEDDSSDIGEVVGSDDGTGVGSLSSIEIDPRLPRGMVVAPFRGGTLNYAPTVVAATIERSALKSASGGEVRDGDCGNSGGHSPDETSDYHDAFGFACCTLQLVTGRTKPWGDPLSHAPSATSTLFGEEDPVEVCMK